MKKPIEKSRQTKSIFGTIPNAFKCAKTLVQTLSIETFFILSWQKRDNLTCVSSIKEIMRSINKWEVEKEREKSTYNFHCDYRMGSPMKRLPIQPWFHVCQHRCRPPTALSTNNHNPSACLQVSFRFIRMLIKVCFFFRSILWAASSESKQKASKKRCCAVDS